MIHNAFFRVLKLGVDIPPNTSLCLRISETKRMREILCEELNCQEVHRVVDSIQPKKVHRVVDSIQRDMKGLTEVRLQETVCRIALNPTGYEGIDGSEAIRDTM